jgi:hypothetical protein
MTPSWWPGPLVRRRNAQAPARRKSALIRADTADAVARRPRPDCGPYNTLIGLTVTTMRTSDRSLFRPVVSPAPAARLIRACVRGVCVAACLAGLGLGLAASAARAQDQGAADADDLKDRFLRAFSLDKIGSVHVPGITKKEQEAIDYRERSPLVVPRTTDLPPPESAPAPRVTNFPQDPGPARKKTAGRVVATPQPGTSELPEKQGAGLAVSAKDFVNAFASDKSESAPFGSEPPRQVLTQPPVGYQTPSPDYAYGLGAAGANTGPQAPRNSLAPVPK